MTRADGNQCADEAVTCWVRVLSAVRVIRRCAACGPPNASMAADWAGPFSEAELEVWRVMRQ
jgi:hypothetical protein